MRRKKLFSLLCAAAFTLSAFGGVPVSAEPGGETAQVETYAESGDFMYETNDTGIKITQYHGNDTAVTIPGEINGKKVTEIAAGAFSNLTSYLTSVTIPDSVTVLTPDAFNRCPSMTSISVDPNNPTYSSVSGVLYSKDGKKLISCPAGRDTHFEIPDGVTEIGDWAFQSCDDLPSIVIPNSVTRIGHYAFSNCNVLLSVTIPNSVTEIGKGAFFYSKNLTRVTIPNNVTEIGEQTFSGCENLTSIMIPDSVTSIGDNSFSGCANLTSITIPNSVISIGDAAFSGCKFTSVTIPGNITSIGRAAFSGCDSLTSFSVDPDNSSYVSVSGIIFSKDEKTLVAYPTGKTESQFAIPDGVTEIGGGAFSGCQNLSDVTIPNTVTEIGYAAFTGCKKITDITIPESVTAIDKFAFSECTGLTKITILNSKTALGGLSLPSYTKKCTIYGYAGSTAENYAEFYQVPFVSLGAPSAPTFTPDGGTFTKAQTVTIECTTTGAEIYYTLDGSVPTASSAKYTDPVSVTESVTLKAVAIKDGLSSDVTSADFTIDLSETKKSGFYSDEDGKTITEAALGEIVTQTTEDKNEKHDIRFIQKANGSSLSGKSKATFTLTSNGVTKKVSTSKYYTGLTFDDGTKAAAASGQVFLCYTVKDVPEGVTVEATAIELE